MNYTEWAKVQSELTKRAKELFVKLHPVLKYNKRRSYELQSIDVAEVTFITYAYGDTDTETFDSQFLFLTDEEIDAYIELRLKEEAEARKQWELAESERKKQDRTREVETRRNLYKKLKEEFENEL